MSKIKKKYLLIISIIFVVYNVLVFAIPYPHKSDAVFITAWVAGLIAILAQIYFGLVAFGKKDTLKSKLYGLPIARIGLIYLVVQLILTVLFLVVGAFIEIPYWIVIIPIVIILALAAIGLIVADTYRDEIEKIEECAPLTIKFMNNFKAYVAVFTKRNVETPIYKKLEFFNDEVKYSDPVSSEELAEIENEINVKFNELKELTKVSKFDEANLLLDDLISLIQERNLKCKQVKK